MGTTITQNSQPRTTIRLALPSKGRMEEETLALLRDCGLAVQRVNPRQYIATIAQIPGLEVWFQRSADVVRKVRDGEDRKSTRLNTSHSQISYAVFCWKQKRIFS